MANLVIVVGEHKVHTVKDLKPGTVYRKTPSGNTDVPFMKIGTFGATDNYHSVNLSSGNLASFDPNVAIEELPEVRIVGK